MIHKLFYRGQFCGTVFNQLNSSNHCWICPRCGELFAKRFSPVEAIWTIWTQDYCAKCTINYTFKYAPSCFYTTEFRRGGDLPAEGSLRLQLLFEIEAYEHYQRYLNEPARKTV